MTIAGFAPLVASGIIIGLSAGIGFAVAKAIFSRLD